MLPETMFKKGESEPLIAIVQREERALVLLAQPRKTTSWQQGGNARKISTTDSALGEVNSGVTGSRAPLHDADCAINLGSENTGSNSLTSIGVYSPGEISQYYRRNSNDKDTAPIEPTRTDCVEG